MLNNTSFNKKRLSPGWKVLKYVKEQRKLAAA